jgi:hypothetical protein
VDVQTRNGEVTTLVVESGAAQALKIRNPWPGKPVDVISMKTRKKIVSGAAGTVIEFPATAGTYVVEKHNEAGANSRVTVVSGTRATSARRLGPVQIGLFPLNQ